MSRTERQADCPQVPGMVAEDLLASRRRCLLVTALAAAGGEAVVDDLAAALLAAEQQDGPGGTEPDADALERELYDHHLPKFTATGLVEYDSMLNSVRLTEPTLASLARVQLTEQ